MIAIWQFFNHFNHFQFAFIILLNLQPSSSANKVKFCSVQTQLIYWTIEPKTWAQTQLFRKPA